MTIYIIFTMIMAIYTTEFGDSKHFFLWLFFPIVFVYYLIKGDLKGFQKELFPKKFN